METLDFSAPPSPSSPSGLSAFVRNPLTLAFAASGVVAAVARFTTGAGGLLGPSLEGSGFLFWFLLWCAAAHLTITCMSLSFHRAHTHRGTSLHPVVDGAMQGWLWLATSMCKRDWVSVHIHHHAHSDSAHDPHSPVHKGFWRVFLLGTVDYANARNSPAVVKLRKKIPENRVERFYREHILVGPVLLFTTLAFAIGPFRAAVAAILTFAISPFLAVGGVNTLAHWFGYRTYRTTDNSRNIGFLFPLNFLICGELDHNNHHAHPRSASFQHRWYEFDIGYLYLRGLSALGLATLHQRAPSRRLLSRPADPMIGS